MLKKTITYETVDGDEVSDIFYFNLSKAELIEMEVEQKQGLSALLQNIIDTKDNHELVKQFKKLILMSYGVKSDDGKRFIKSDQLREEFSQMDAYNVLFMELASSDDAAVVFLNGIVPKDMQGAVTKEAIQAKIKEGETAGKGPAPLPPVRKDITSNAG